MVVLLFGIENIGKTTLGRKLAEVMGFDFYDLEDEVYKKFDTHKERFIKEHPFPLKRSKIKGRVLRNIINNCDRDTVIAVSFLNYARDFNPLVDLDHVLAIELLDTKENVHARTEYPSEESGPVDKKFLLLRAKQQQRDIHHDILTAARINIKIKNKVNIADLTIDEAVQKLQTVVETKRV